MYCFYLFTRHAPGLQRETFTADFYFVLKVSREVVYPDSLMEILITNLYCVLFMYTVFTFNVAFINKNMNVYMRFLQYKKCINSVHLTTNLKQVYKGFIMLFSGIWY